MYCTLLQVMYGYIQEYLLKVLTHSLWLVIENSPIKSRAALQKYGHYYFYLIRNSPGKDYSLIEPI